TGRPEPSPPDGRPGRGAQVVERRSGESWPRACPPGPGLASRVSDAGAEVGAEGGEVGAVDEPVAVDVEGREVVRVARPGTEGGAEQGEVGAVDEAVAVDVAEEAVELVAGRRPAVGED